MTILTWEVLVAAVRKDADEKDVTVDFIHAVSSRDGMYLYYRDDVAPEVYYIPAMEVFLARVKQEMEEDEMVDAFWLMIREYMVGHM